MRIKTKAILGLICLVSFVIALVPTVLLPKLDAIAQSSEVCYFITPSGSRIDLSKLCSTSTPASVPNSTPTSRPNVVQVKIKEQGGSTPVLDVVFNNKTFEMILNMEEGSTWITPKMARELGVSPRGTINISAGDGSVVEFPAGYIDSISVGGKVVNNVKVAIVPRGDIGILGYDILGNYHVTVKPDVVEFTPGFDPSY